MARLVDVAADAILDQATLTGLLTDVLRIEETLASRLAARLTPIVPTNAALGPTTSNLAAYQLVTDARALYALGRFAETRSSLLKATSLDPRYALAWALLAKSSARLMSPAVVTGHPNPDALRGTLDEATTAATLAPTLAESQVALALAYRGLQDRDRARDAAAAAVALIHAMAKRLSFWATRCRCRRAWGVRRIRSLMPLRPRIWKAFVWIRSPAART